MLETAYLLTGTNLGDRLAHLEQAAIYIGNRAGNITASSAIYETAAWGIEDQPTFYNQVLVLQTALAPEALLTQLLAIEQELGRIRTIKFGPRVIDIDILLMGNAVINTALLSVPHPALPFRRFALTPLCEVAPYLMHPVENKTITELLSLCTDALNVQKITSAIVP